MSRGVESVMNADDIVKIGLGMASKEYIISSSYGEVTKPETINYRTLKPEKDGLFCARIFGPIKSYECVCGKYKRMKYRGIVCDRCGVEITDSSVRRNRMGHIMLASPVVHIWYLRSKISVLLDLPIRTLEHVLYYNRYIVVDPGITSLERYTLLTEEKFHEVLEEYGSDSFVAMIGAEAIENLLSALDLKDLSVSLRAEFQQCTAEIRRKKLAKRLRLVMDLLSSSNKPEWMVLRALPVIPPGLRPLLKLDGGRFATSDKNDGYRRVIVRNFRLKRLMALCAPAIIIRSEQRMLQEAVDMLFDNSKRAKSGRGFLRKTQQKSLSDSIKGKQGRFRQNLLGKRVDYSGRSVIVTGSKLSLNQCGLPKKMALELFKPFIYGRLEMYGYATTIKTARRIVEAEKPEVWDILDEVIREHPVLLNRAPTLHRLSIQAFEPVLIEGNAIRLHPLVCAAFNADFDGDQMAVHIPLSIEAQLEAKIIMLSVHNMLNPANGRPIVVPSKDMVLGLYYLSLKRGVDESQRRRVFTSIGEVEYALETDILKLHDVIRYRVRVMISEGCYEKQLHETTPGRAILFDLLPKHPKLSMSVVNTILSAKKIVSLVGLVYQYCGQAETAIFVDRLKDIGFEYATLSGVSFGIGDMLVPETKWYHITKANEEINKFELQYQEGFITEREKYNKAIDVWSKCAERVSDDVMKMMSQTMQDGQIGDSEDLNSIFMMANSGARGSVAQIKQLAGMRGLMSKPSGEIIERPILSNFKEGLSVLEFFISTHGARKGLSDTALKTANSGYLTRRLVDVAQDCVVIEHDCETKEGIVMRQSIDGSTHAVEEFIQAISNRVSLRDICMPFRNDEVIVQAGEVITPQKALVISTAGVDAVEIRSPVLCRTRGGICQKCYGIDLSTGLLVAEGEAVGVIAAQSIGEPGTQLTMRTFHIGGAAMKHTEISNVDATVDGTVSVLNSNVVSDSTGNHIMMSRVCQVVLHDSEKVLRGKYSIPYGARIYVQDGVEVKAGTRIADWDPYTLPIITEKSGTIHYVDLLESVSMDEVVDEVTDVASRIIIDWRSNVRGVDLKPHLVLKDEQGDVVQLSNDLNAVYHMPIGAILNVQDGQSVHAGDVLARIPRESSKTRDITGGLPRVAELFEARKPKEHAIISSIDGYVTFGKDYKAKRKIIVKPENSSDEAVEYLIPKGRHLTVTEGSFIRKGAMILEGTPDLRDVLRVMGLEGLVMHMLPEVQKIYKLQGVEINNKHIEVIIRQMTRKVVIRDSGDMDFLAGEELHIEEYLRILKECEDENKRAPIVEREIEGITKKTLKEDSPIAAASFQETVKVLTDAAFAGRFDYLNSMKENVILGGRLIPAGTGYIYRKKVQEAKNMA